MRGWGGGWQHFLHPSYDRVSPYLLSSPLSVVFLDPPSTVLKGVIWPRTVYIYRSFSPLVEGARRVLDSGYMQFAMAVRWEKLLLESTGHIFVSPCLPRYE